SHAVLDGGTGDARARAGAPRRRQAVAGGRGGRAATGHAADDRDLRRRAGTGVATGVPAPRLPGAPVRARGAGRRTRRPPLRCVRQRRRQCDRGDRRAPAAQVRQRTDPHPSRIRLRAGDGMTRHSLRWRLLLAAAAGILLALALAWLFMTLLFERHLERRLEAEMTRDALGLVSALAFDPRGQPSLQSGPGDPRLDRPAGGYYWQVSTASGVLRSRSLWDSALPVPVSSPAGGWRLRYATGPFGRDLAVLEREVVVDADHPAVVVQFAQDRAPLADARSEFGRELALF